MHSSQVPHSCFHYLQNFFLHQNKSRSSLLIHGGPPGILAHISVSQNALKLYFLKFTILLASTDFIHLEIIIPVYNHLPPHLRCFPSFLSQHPQLAPLYSSSQVTLQGFSKRYQTNTHTHLQAFSPKICKYFLFTLSHQSKQQNLHFITCFHF